MHRKPGAALRIVASLFVVLPLLLLSCGGRRWGHATGDRSVAGVKTLAAQVRLNEGSYAAGEPVVMTLQVVNLSASPLHLTFPTAQRYDFIVTRGRERVWEWAGGRMFAQVIGGYDLAAGDTLTFHYTWDQTGADGTKLTLGAYTIEGMLMTSPPVVTAPRAFGIVD
jgi:hypothetical protein